MEPEIVSLDDREHLLLRPDTLCGSTKSIDHPGHHYVRTDDNALTVTQKTLVFAPAIKNLFQEILTNALDRQFRDDKMKKIEVWVDCEAAGGLGWVRVKNDGQGLPVVHDEARGAWKPTIAFSHFRSGSNFDDSAGPRWTAGRNGYGCKATNVFSLFFAVETADPATGLLFSQTFSNNMLTIGAPLVRPYKLKKGYTDVSFRLDLARLGAPDASMTPDVRDMICNTTVDATACLSRKVSLALNGKTLGINSLRHFGLMFSPHVAVDTVNIMWEVCVAAAPEGSLGFVNSLQCSEGTHINFAYTRLNAALEEHMRTKYKKPALTLSPAMVRHHIFLIVKLLVDSPEFSSQTKEKLTTPVSRFADDVKAWKPTPAFIKQLGLTGIIDQLFQDVSSRELSVARRAMVTTTSSSSSTRRLVIADKYDAATNVTKSKSNCSLLLTEGDSARALAVAGLAVVGRANFGIYALKGKPLNVRNASLDAISKNKEVTTLLNILGLTIGKTYTSMDALNYKKLVIFSDQDPDGAHIGGLIFNIIHALFPSVLLLDPCFVQRFPTPLVRVTEKNQVVRSFYAAAPFNTWWTSLEPRVAKRYTVKYFKGLGTSTSSLAREYFAEYTRSIVDIVWEPASNDLMTQMFQNDNASSRRALLVSHFTPGNFVDYSQRRVSLSDFIHKEVLPYSNYSNERNLPSVIDGLKPVQRKALFTLLDKNIVNDVKVAQVAAEVAAKTMYHHGEQSLVEAVIGMAQDHVGVSNINVFRPEGQFGSRLDPPSVHSAARYIFTGLDPIARALFVKDDDPVLQYKEEEGQSIEPHVFVPVIPTVLVNGAFGIGTGWSTSVACYNPADLIERCRSIARGDLLRPSSTLTPWYSGFRGTIEYLPEKNTFRTRGTMVISPEGTSIHITELPVGVWTHPFVQNLEEKWMVGSTVPTKRKRAGDEGFIVSIEKRWTDSNVDMVLHCNPETVIEMGEELLWTVLGMQTEIRTTNMHLYTHEGTLKHFETTEEIIEDFARVRLSVYLKRRANMISNIQHELEIVTNKSRFINMIIAKTLDLSVGDDDFLVNTLTEAGFKSENGGFGYLLDMSLRSMTTSHVSRLETKLASLTEELERVKAFTPQTMWLHDLDGLEGALVNFFDRKTARYSAVPTTTIQKPKKKVGSIVKK